jgi:hypothetical protein
MVVAVVVDDLPCHVWPPTHRDGFGSLSVWAHENRVCHRLPPTATGSMTAKETGAIKQRLTCGHTPIRRTESNRRPTHYESQFKVFRGVRD